MFKQQSRRFKSLFSGARPASDRLNQDSRRRAEQGKKSIATFVSLLVVFLLASLFTFDASAQVPRFVAPKFSNSAPKIQAEKKEPAPSEAPSDANAPDLLEPNETNESTETPVASEATDLNAAIELPPNAPESPVLPETDESVVPDASTTLELSPSADAAESSVLNATTPTGSAAKNAVSNAVERAPYDPIKENGEYFVDWEKPEVALVFTGLTNGYIEPCGCAGMDRMKGGLSRRNTFLRDLRDNRGWDVVAVDAGQITVGFGVQEELKFDMASNAFRLMEYDAIGLGKGELRFPAYFLLTFTAPTSATTPSLFTSANVGIYGFHPTYALPYKIVERGGLKIGVVSVVCPSDDLEHRDENILIESPEKKLDELAPTFSQAGCDRWILIVHGTEAETNALAKKFPTFDFVVTADSPSEPPAELKALDASKSQHLIEVGEKGKFAVVLGLYPNGKIRYQRVALDSRYESSVEISLLMKDYQTILKTLISTKGYRAGLGVTPVRSPNADLLGKYVGAKKCQSCHEESYRVWLRSRHATAWKSLKETATPPRDFDPECIGCHVDGWEGLQHFPYVDGFVSEDQTPNQLNVGCESCHGPGERHVAAELDADEATQKKIRAAMRLGENVKKVCYSCHDGDNSPEFDYDVYYPVIEHAEEGVGDDE